MIYIGELREQIYHRFNNVVLRIRGLEHDMRSFDDSWATLQLLLLQLEMQIMDQ